MVVEADHRIYVPGETISVVLYIIIRILDTGAEKNWLPTASFRGCRIISLQVETKLSF